MFLLHVKSGVVRPLQNLEQLLFTEVVAVLLLLWGVQCTLQLEIRI